MTAILMSRFSCTAVASSLQDIWKPPSPITAQTSRSGRPILAPIADGRPKPIVPRPPEVIQRSG